VENNILGLNFNERSRGHKRTDQESSPERGYFVYLVHFYSHSWPVKGVFELENVNRYVSGE
jgi:hypothetical protein